MIRVAVDGRAAGQGACAADFDNRRAVAGGLAGLAVAAALGIIAGGLAGLAVIAAALAVVIAAAAGDESQEHHDRQKHCKKLLHGG